MNKDRIQQFLDRIKSEREELREDLRGLPLNAPEYKAGDFGCGWGYITWCLTVEVPNSQCIGIDKFDPNNPPSFEDIFRNEKFSIDSVQNQFKGVIDDIKSGTIVPQGNDLLSDIRHIIIDRERYPVFQIGDLITGENLSPSLDPYFDLIYCKRVLYNIFVGDNKNPDRDDGVNLAINHIASVLKSDGWFCFVEVEALRNSSNLEDSLKRFGFRFDNPRRVNRPYRTIEGDNDQYPYLIYHCKKTKL